MRQRQEREKRERASERASERERPVHDGAGSGAKTSDLACNLRSLLPPSHALALSSICLTPSLSPLSVSRPRSLLPLAPTLHSLLPNNTHTLHSLLPLANALQPPLSSTHSLLPSPLNLFRLGGAFRRSAAGRGQVKKIKAKNNLRTKKNQYGNYSKNSKCVLRRAAAGRGQVSLSLFSLSCRGQAHVLYL